MMRGFENYESNTGKRHPLQPDVIPGVKRGVGNGNVPLDYVYYVDEPFWFGMFARFRDRLRLRSLL
jgi:hypothetical protein